MGEAALVSSASSDRAGAPNDQAVARPRGPGPAGAGTSSLTAHHRRFRSVSLANTPVGCFTGHHPRAQQPLTPSDTWPLKLPGHCAQLIRCLQKIGVTKVVITLGYKGEQLAAAIGRENFSGVHVHFVWCESSFSRGHASNLMAARSMFTTDEPLLIVVSDHLFEHDLLARLAASYTPSFEVRRGGFASLSCIRTATG